MAQELVPTTNKTSSKDLMEIVESIKNDITTCFKASPDSPDSIFEFMGVVIRIGDCSAVSISMDDTEDKIYDKRSKLERTTVN
jgi:hypothetical protein